MRKVMEKRFYGYCIFAMYLAFMGCRVDKAQEQLSLQTIEIDPTNTGSVKLSQIFSGAELICFNTGDIVYIRPEKLIVRGGHYYMKSGHTIIVCDENKNLQFVLSRRGNGPGEYIDMADFQVDENGNVGKRS